MSVKTSITAYVQDKTVLEKGLFDDETAPEELSQIRMGRIIAEKYPEFSDEDQEAVRQHAVAAIALTQEAKAQVAKKDNSDQPTTNTAFIEGVRQFVTDVRDLDIDLIDRINPFQSAYAILSKAMDQDTLRNVAAVIGAKKIQLSHEEARDLAKRAVVFKKQHNRLPSLTAADPWERRMAEGVAFLQRKATRDE